MAIIQSISDQSAFNFTGRLNVLLKKNNQHIALIFLKDGLIVNCIYGDKDGLSAIYNLLFDERNSSLDLKVMPEPEIVEDSEIKIGITLDELKVEASQYVDNQKKFDRLKPPKNVRIFPSPEFLLEGENLNFKEFKTLCSLTKYNNVDEIYQNSEFIEHETTMLLVRLRQKGAVRVVASKEV